MREPSPTIAVARVALARGPNRELDDFSSRGRVVGDRCHCARVDDDARLEAALDRGAGQVRRWRTFRANAPQVRVGHDAIAQIIRDFAPDHGLLFPFLAPSAEIAAQLVAAALPDAPGEYEVQLPDGPVHAALLAASARPSRISPNSRGPCEIS